MGAGTVWRVVRGAIVVYSRMSGLWGSPDWRTVHDMVIVGKRGVHRGDAKPARGDLGVWQVLCCMSPILGLSASVIVPFGVCIAAVIACRFLVDSWSVVTGG
jgi:hypothetical protein